MCSASVKGWGKDCLQISAKSVRKKGIHECELQDIGKQYTGTCQMGIHLGYESVNDDYLSIFQANKEPFSTRGASNDFDISNERLHQPFSLLHPLE